MDVELEDERAREAGRRANLGLESIALSVWSRSAEIIREAEELHGNFQLSADRSHSLLIALIEQRKVYSGLKKQVGDGIRAAKRIDQRADEAAEKKRREEYERTHGKNRFGRSKAG